jgi:uncharacterized membrane protein
MFYLLLQKIKDIYNEMAKRREKKEQTMVHKTLHRKLTITHRRFLVGFMLLNL